MISSFSGFARSSTGNVGIMTGIMFGMVAMATGGAVDVTSAHNYRADLQAIADRAALHGARVEDRSAEDTKDFVLDALKKFTVNKSNVKVTKEEGEVTVKIEGASANRFMGLFGMNSFDVGVEAKAANAGDLANDIEVALVLDVTESMADDMPALRAAALQLVNSLYEAGEEKVKISVVPYTSTVNIGSNAPMEWMDTNAQSTHHATEIEDVLVKICESPPSSSSSSSSSTTTSTPSCNKFCGCPGETACGGGNDGASLDLLDKLQYASTPLLQRLGALMTPGAAEAGSHSYTAPAATDCPASTPQTINNFELFEAIPNTDWMGCVEARPAPHDVTDTDPSAGDFDARFVPFFWYDDSDQYDASYTWLNNYIGDHVGLTVASPARYTNWHISDRSSVYKYDGVTMSDIVETGADMRGPNRSCPAPILPLTSAKSDVVGKINALTHRNGGGTVISEGLAWGWRVISPGQPFAQGVPYDQEETKKIIILLSDGANAVQQRGEDPDGSSIDEDVIGDFTAYGYASSFDTGGRKRNFIDKSSNPSASYFDQVRGYLDERTQLVCDNIKSAGGESPIEIFSILVGDHDERTRGLLSACATSEATHYKNATQMDELTRAFSEVASEIIGSGRARIVH